MAATAGLDNGFILRDTVFGHEFCAESSTTARAQDKMKEEGGQRAGALTTGAEMLDFLQPLPAVSNDDPERSLVPKSPNASRRKKAALTEPSPSACTRSPRRGWTNSVALVVGCGPVGLAVIAALKPRAWAGDRRRLLTSAGAPQPNAWAPTMS